MRALVTGGAGFIGSHVVDALVERGDDVWVLDNLASGRRENVNAGSRLVEADVRDAGAVASAFAEAKPETCFHLAAQADVRVSIAEPAFDAEVNVIGTANVLEAARANEAKVVFSSTGGAIYGECDGPADENSPRLPGPAVTPGHDVTSAVISSLAVMSQASPQRGAATIGNWS